MFRRLFGTRKSKQNSQRNTSGLPSLEEMRATMKKRNENNEKTRYKALNPEKPVNANNFNNNPFATVSKSNPYASSTAANFNAQSWDPFGTNSNNNPFKAASNKVKQERNAAAAQQEALAMAGFNLPSPVPASAKVDQNRRTRENEERRQKTLKKAQTELEEVRGQIRKLEHRRAALEGEIIQRENQIKKYIKELTPLYTKRERLEKEIGIHMRGGATRKVKRHH